MNIEQTAALRVAAVRAEAKDVISIELVDPNGRPLVAIEPGAHVDLHLPNGLVRQYSLLQSCQNPSTYRIAIARAPTSRGGSIFLHNQVRVGLDINVGQPRNLFGLVSHSSKFHFIAGGIGITPILSMVSWCETNSVPWSLLYCCRHRQHAAFVEELRATKGGERTFYFGDEHDGRRPNLAAYLARVRSGEHVYCCGSPSLTEAVAVAAKDLPDGTVHFESFLSAPAGPAADGEGFEVYLSQSNIALRILPGQSILEALESAGLSPAYGCRTGFCGCCQVRVISGTPDHRDSVMPPAERASNKSIMICVSRSTVAKLVLDL